MQDTADGQCGPVALVTGAGRGIGRAVAEKLAAEGCRIVVNDLDPGPAQEVADGIVARGGRAVVCAGSVTGHDFPDRFVGAAVQAFGGVDIIVNNAGYTWNAYLGAMSDEQWDTLIEVHLTAPFRILRAAQPVIRAAVKAEQAAGVPVPCRKVVNVSSIVGTAGSASQANYSSAKAGLLGLTRTLAKEWGRYNVTVNAVAFGIITTRLTTAVGADSTTEVGGRPVTVGATESILSVLESGASAAPLGRAGTPEEAAGAVWLLCSPESSYVTGQVLECAGGLQSV
ncbi:SDR family oxidoreductase [Nakamurella sp. YIM 132087]|uniref:SDR family oxidoreductase n=1 Tax=Nakamurella alba TaxID=2665158 RepID=A0A7K1FFZ6_9ACTN|nr:SDR family oxidoreductase [Nakamurella alba]MTD13028.1 SDR family oxidoreductase [Nakamurella alba]